MSTQVKVHAFNTLEKIVVFCEEECNHVSNEVSNLANSDAVYSQTSV
jgi:hypothetical protein